MTKENAILDKEEKINEDLTDSFDFDELEEKLQSQLDEELADMQFLAEEKEKIGNPDNLGNMIMEVVWEQFLNQVAITAGEDFIKENNGLTLDLRKEAHIQTTENFAEGKIAKHNTEINYQERYDDWQANFVKDENGNVVTRKTSSGKEEAVLVKGARKPFDKGRPRGSAEKHTDMDHIVPAAEIIRDPSINAHMTKDEQVALANAPENLNEMDSRLNRSKGDRTTQEWISAPNGQKPNAEDGAELLQKDAKARETIAKKKEECEQRSIEAGKKSQRQEAFRIGGKVLRAVLMQLLGALIKEIIAKLVKWFKSAKKEWNTLLDSLKEAIHSFIEQMKTHLIDAGNTVFSTVTTAIIGPVIGTIKKVWILLKQGWNSLKSAIDYIKAPANKGKSIDILLMEVGKIVIAGLTGAGALLLGEVIEKGLMTIPIFAFEIPLLGSLANILGIFLGAVVSGIIGAIVINLIEKQIEQSMKRKIVNAQIEKGNEILNLQYQVQMLSEVRLEHEKTVVANNINERHLLAANVMDKSVENIRANCATDESVQDIFDDIDNLFDKL